MPLHERLQPAASAAFRGLFSLIFIVAGFGHLRAPDPIIARLEAAPYGAWALMVAPAGVLVAMTGVVLLIAGLALLVGLRTRSAALLLAAVLITITVTVQVGAEGAGPLFKNIALFGGLLHFMTAGGGAFALDEVIPRHQPQPAAA